MVTLSFDVGTLVKFLLAATVAFLAFLFLRAVWLTLRRWLFSPTLHGLDRKGIQARWSEIELMTAGGGEMNLKMAVMEADKLLDHALKAMAFPGLTLGERLKFAAYRFPRIGDVWWAHRLRNQLVHESSFYLEPGMAKKAIGVYKKTLQMLNVL
jgi:hypothetical protein